MSAELGISAFPGGGIDNQLKQLSYKYSTKKTENKWQSSFGFLYIGQIDFGGGFIFGSFTNGDNDNNISITPGLGYLQNSDEGLEFSENLTLVLSTKKRASNTLSLISENWIFVNSGNVTFISNSGIRFFGKQLSVDFSWPFFLASGNSFLGFPLISFTYIF